MKKGLKLLGCALCAIALFGCKNQSNDDDKYMLARFTELVLVHFSYYIDKICIE